MSDWEYKTLEQIAPLSYGKSLTRDLYSDIGTIPVFGSGGIIGYTTTAITEKPTIIIGRKGSVGSLYFSSSPNYPIDTTFYTNGSSEVDIQYVYYLLQTLALNTMNSDSAVPGLNRDRAHSIRVYIPKSKHEQKRIAHILGTLDDKIEANRQQNITLEEIARAIFKSWFVDFDPVHAKARGEMPYGMDAETADLFPDSFEESEMGLIPHGWRVGTVGEEITVVDYVSNGSFASLKENVTLFDKPSYALYIRLVDYNNNFSEGFKYISREAHQYLGKSKLVGDETIISNVGANAGTVFRAPVWLNMPMTLGSNAIACKNHNLRNWMFYYFTSELGQHEISSIIGGSAQPKFNKTDFRSLRILLAPKDIIDAFNKIVDPNYLKQVNNLSQIRTLTETRDSLLPKLISGEIQLEGLDGQI